MKHVFLFCYIISIIIGVCALTLQWISYEAGSAGKVSRRGLFAIAITVVNSYMMLIYYNENIWRGLNRETLLGIGNLMMIILMFTWLAAEESIAGEGKKSVCIINGSLLLYACLCFAVGSIRDRDGFAGVFLTLPLFVILLIEGYRAVRTEIRKSGSRAVIWYEMTQTLLMCFVFFMYMRNDGRAKLPVLCWIPVNLVNLAYIYRRIVLSTGMLSGASGAAKSADDIITDMQMSYSLTNREKELVQEIYKGRSNGEIADELFISESTVKAHIYNIFRKTGVKNRMEIVCMIRERVEK